MEEESVSCDYLIDTYATERLKTLGVWSQFAGLDLHRRPRAGDRRGRSLLEQMVHQCLSENGWFCKMLGIDVGAPPLPEEETVAAFVDRYAEDSLRREDALRQQPGSWWEEDVAFFEVMRSRAWVMVRRIAHTAHHRGQQTALLRMLGRSLYSTYGPTADTGGLPLHQAPTRYPWSDLDALRHAVREGEVPPPLPPLPTHPLTERPDAPPEHTS